MPEHLLCSKEDKEYVNHIKKKYCFKSTEVALRHILDEHRKENGDELKILQTRLEQLMQDHGGIFEDYGGFKGKVFKQLLGFLAVHPVKGVEILRGIVTYAEEEIEMQGYTKSKS